MRFLTLAAAFLGLTGVVLTLLRRVAPHLATRPGDTVSTPSRRDSEIIDVTTDATEGEHSQPLDLRRGAVIDLTDAAIAASRSDGQPPASQG